MLSLCPDREVLAWSRQVCGHLPPLQRVGCRPDPVSGLWGLCPRPAWCLEVRQASVRRKRPARLSLQVHRVLPCCGPALWAVLSTGASYRLPRSGSGLTAPCLAHREPLLLLGAARWGRHPTRLSLYGAVGIHHYVLCFDSFMENVDVFNNLLDITGVSALPAMNIKCRVKGFQRAVPLRAPGSG